MSQRLYISTSRNLWSPTGPLKGRSSPYPLIGRGFPCYFSNMTAESTYAPDATDWRILDVLQREGRASFAELARAVSMSASAVTERVRRLEEAG